MSNMSNTGVKDDLDQLLLRQAEENIAKAKNVLQKLYTIWNKLGIEKEHQVNRAQQVWGHILCTFYEILDEDITRYKEKKEFVKNCEKQISELLDELALPEGEKVVGTLLIKEETLSQQVAKLNAVKNKRVKDFEELSSLETEYCKILGMPTLNLSSTSKVPTEEDIYELKQHVNMLKGEKELRQKRLLMLKRELTTILEVTEFTPETPLEKEILTSKEDSLSLSNETFKLLEQIVTKTKCKKAELENEKAALMDRLIMLWDILKIEKIERDTFLLKHTFCRVSSLNAIKEEIERCESIKRQNIKKYVDALHDELAALCEKCFIHNSEFLGQLFEVDELNESVLESYDKEVSKWRNFYKETEHIIQKIRKRQELWDLMIIFENKANNPNRFKNRGGNLLQEERERKKLQKNLPALENEIFALIDQYEQQSGKKFLYYGEKFQYFVTEQWENRNAQKESEKKIRQKLRAQQLEEERTPAKILLLSTPKSAPSKLVKSSVGISVYKTPNFSISRRAPLTTVKARNNKMLALKSNSNKKVKKNILKETGIEENTSDSHDTTTYKDFAEKLNRPSRYGHQSSILTSKKIVGTKISANKSKRKSRSVPTRKVLQKKASTSSITPARGKLGLPFLA